MFQTSPWRTRATAQSLKTESTSEGIQSKLIEKCTFPLLLQIKSSRFFTTYFAVVKLGNNRIRKYVESIAEKHFYGMSSSKFITWENVAISRDGKYVFIDFRAFGREKFVLFQRHSEDGNFLFFSCVNCRFLFDPENFLQQSQQLNNSKVYLFFGSTPPTRLSQFSPHGMEIVWEIFCREFMVYFMGLLLLRLLKCCGAWET